MYSKGHEALFGAANERQMATLLAKLTRVESPRNIAETRDMTETSLSSIGGESARLIVGLRG